MKKRRILIAVLSGILAVTPITAYAAEGWVQDERGWRYEEFDGRWRTDGWVTDENNENIGYYLDENGYMLTNCYTPSGVWVDENGAWYDENYGEVKAVEVQTNRVPTTQPIPQDYPLQGTFPYTIADDGMAYPFTNNIEYAQINDFNPRGMMEMYNGYVLCYLAGLPTPTLTDYELAVALKTKEFLNSFDWKNASEYEKAYQAALFIAERCNYSSNTDDIGSVENNTSYGCLINGQSLCDGFAQAYHLLTRAVGLRSYQVRSISHSWNYVEIDGTLYELDLTNICDNIFTFDNKLSFIKEDLTKVNSFNASKEYIWTLNGATLQFDKSIPTEPLF